MAQLYSASKTYVSRVLGAEGDTTQVAAAGDAIRAAIAEWNIRHDFSTHLMDTSGGYAVASCANTSGAVTTSTSNGFAAVNVGQTFTVTDGAPAGTYTVSAVTSTTAITATGGGGNFSAEGLTFSADIPLQVGTDTYALPSPILRPYSARLLTNERVLEYKEQRFIDRAFAIQTPLSTPMYYNLFNTSGFTVGTQNGKVRVFPTPGQTETLRVRYFRPITTPTSDSDNIDLPDHYVPALEALARYYFLMDHDAENARLGELKERSEILFREMKARDEQRTEDNDMVLVAQIEHGIYKHLDPDDIRFFS